MELDKLIVKIEADVDAIGRGLADASEKVSDFTRKIEGTVALAAQRAREAAHSAAQAMEQQYQLDMARIKEGQARGFLTPAEAQKAGREAAAAYNRGIIAALDKATLTPGAFQGKTGREAFAQIAGSLKSVNVESKSASVGISRLNASLVSMARQAAGVHPAIAQLSNVLGSMALGGGVMAGVLAGGAALAALWRRLTDEARDLEKKANDAAAAVLRIARDRDSQGLGDHIDRVRDLGKQYDELGRRVDAARDALERAARPNARGLVDETAVRQANEKLNSLLERRTTLLDAQREAERQLADERRRNSEREARDAQAAAERQRRAADEARRNRVIAPLGLAATERTAETLGRLRSEMARLAEQMRALEFDRAFATKGEEFDRLTASIEEGRRRLALFNEEAQRTFLQTRTPAALAGGAPALGFQPRLPQRDFAAELRQPAQMLSQVFASVAGELQRAQQVVSDYVTAGLDVNMMSKAQREELERSIAIVREHNRAVQNAAERINAISFFDQQRSMVGGALQNALSILSPAGLLSTAIGQLTSQIQSAFFGLFHRRKDPVPPLERAATALERVASSLYNAPGTWSVDLARHRIAGAAAGQTNIGTVNISVDSQSTWEGIKQQMRVAASSGDQLARRLVLQTAPKG